MGEEGIGGIEEDEAAAFVVGDAFEHDVAAVGDARDLTSAAEHGHEIGSAIRDDHFERRRTRARNGSDALDLTADPQPFAGVTRSDLDARQGLEARLKTLGIKLLYRRAEPFEGVT
jgi:hypothetical protein